MSNSKRRCGTFPVLQARNLEGKRLALPRDFDGELNLVLVAFLRWQQSQVDSWMPQLTQLSAERPWLRIYEVPILSSLYTLARPFIDGGMASAIQDREVRQRTLTVYTNVPQVLEALDLSTEDTIALFLVDAEGQIVWRGNGAYDEKQASDLLQILDCLHDSTNTIGLTQVASLAGIPGT